MANSYAKRPTVPGEAPKAMTGGAYARAAYATPDGDLPGSDEGFSPALGPASEGMLPDAIRTQKREPIFGGPTGHNIHLRRGLDNLERRSDEVQVSTGWTTRQEKPVRGVFPEQVQDIQPSRPTARMGQNSYLFMRPWNRPKSTGDHVSMADHRRKYEIYGMAPRGGVGVNNYRLDPKPWDANLKYNQVPTESPDGVRATRGISGNRSYRLR